MPSFRFYALYDKLYRDDVLAHAWRLAKANGGTAGVDRQTFRDVDEYGVERWLGELAEDLRKKTYRPQPVWRVYSPKPDGRKLSLGISTIRDRVATSSWRSPWRSRKLRNVLGRVILPLSAGIAVTVILGFMFCWNAFNYPLMLAGRQTFPVTVGAIQFISYEQVLWGQMAVATIVAPVPQLLLSLMVQKYIVRG